jgi:hypothetical protein
VALGAAVWAGAPPADGADEPTARTHQVVAGPQYQAGGMHKFIFGTGYRSVWTTPITVEVLDLGSFGGGLKPEKKGGGKQTKSLHLESPDGREWHFRSVDKDPVAVLPEGLRPGFLQNVARDQISASLPANALVVDPLAEAAGIPYVPRRLVVMPDDERLGEFREEFKGLLGTLEENARAKEPVTRGFEGFEELLDTKELEERLDGDPEQRVDARAYLRARLFDVLIGDYDRHQDQWEWARDRTTRRFVAVPKDRDLAFVKFDGVLLSLVRTEQPRLVNFEDTYPDPLGLMWQARFLDRRHLAHLEWPAWQEVAADLQQRLTDGVIFEAVRRLPPPYYAVAGPTLGERLKARRQGLAAFARRYYELLAREAEVHGTDVADTVRLLRSSDGSVEVVAAGSNGPYFQRRFHPAETKEVRVFLKNGDDRAVSEGGRGGVKVRVVGGDGDDLLDDSAGGDVRFYDDSGDNRIVRGPGTHYDGRSYAPPMVDGHPARDWGGHNRILPWLRIGDGYGAILGASWTHYGYGFRRHPWAARHSIRAGYSTQLETGGVHYDYESRRIDRRGRFGLNARITGLDVIHFHGFGNETSNALPKSFYDVKQTRFVLAPSYRLELQPVDVWIGPVLAYADTRLAASGLLAENMPYGADRFGQVGARLGFRMDRTDAEEPGTRGVVLTGAGTYYPPVWSAEEGFGDVRGEAIVYATAPIPLRPTLAVRVGGEQTFGRYPFHEAAFLGGDDTLRGLRRQRYAGDGSVYVNADLRLLLHRRENGLLRRFGVFGLADTGRVFLDGEASDRWHTGFGGGVWMALADPRRIFSVALAQSEGDLRFYLAGGFMF